MGVVALISRVGFHVYSNILHTYRVDLQWCHKVRINQMVILAQKGSLPRSLFFRHVRIQRINQNFKILLIHTMWTFSDVIKGGLPKWWSLPKVVLCLEVSFFVMSAFKKSIKISKYDLLTGRHSIFCLLTCQKGKTSKQGISLVDLFLYLSSSIYYLLFVKVAKLNPPLTTSLTVRMVHTYRTSCLKVYAKVF